MKRWPLKALSLSLITAFLKEGEVGSQVLSQVLREERTHERTDNHTVSVDTPMGLLLLQLNQHNQLNPWGNTVSPSSQYFKSITENKEQMPIHCPHTYNGDFSPNKEGFRRALFLTIGVYQTSCQLLFLPTIHLSASRAEKKGHWLPLGLLFLWKRQL